MWGLWHVLLWHITKCIIKNAAAFAAGAAAVAAGAAAVAAGAAAVAADAAAIAAAAGAAADPTRPHSMKDVASEVGRDLKVVFSHRVWRHMVIGYTLYTAVLGVYAFWGPKAGKRIYHMSGETADLVFGGVTVVTGILGSLGGGLTLDRIGSSLRNANLVCGISNWVGMVLVLAAFLGASNFTLFMVLFALGEFALFFIQSPVGAIGMWAVPPALRPLAISVTTMAIHVGGDVPSPPLVGAIETALEAGQPPEVADQRWRISMSIISLLLAFSGGVFIRGAFISENAPDYRNHERLPEEEDSQEEGLRVTHSSNGSRQGRDSGSGGGVNNGIDTEPLLPANELDSSSPEFGPSGDLAAVEAGVRGVGSNLIHSRKVPHATSS